MPSSEHQLSVRVPGARKPVGVRIVVPEAVTLVPGPTGSALHGIEERAGAVVGEIDVAFITPDLIIDRSGVLREAARRAADAVVAPPHDGQLVRMGELDLPAGTAFSVEALLARSALPYRTVLVLGHPDVMLPLAVVLTLARARAEWSVGDELLASLSFPGAPAGAAEEVVALPFTSWGR
jgi:hypothetical protein